jgi:hypothetical protein
MADNNRKSSATRMGRGSRPSVLKQGRLNVLGDVELTVRDPYLLDALRQYEAVLKDLTEQVGVGKSEAVENDVYLLCELSRDVTIRLTPFSPEMRVVFEYALNRYQETLSKLKGQTLTKDARAYQSNIQKRVEHYQQYLSTLCTLEPKAQRKT